MDSFPYINLAYDKRSELSKTGISPPNGTFYQPRNLLSYATFIHGKASLQ